MKIIMTIRELIDRGGWSDLCDLRGYCHYSLADGLRDSDEEIVLSLEEIEKIGLHVTL